MTDSVANGTAGDTVYLCAAAVVCSAVTSTQSVALTAASNAFTFSGLDQGSYQVLAFRTAAVHDIQSFTVDAAGIISRAALGLTLP